jgi:hypothetical protein
MRGIPAPSSTGHRSCWIRCPRRLLSARPARREEHVALGDFGRARRARAEKEVRRGGGSRDRVQRREQRHVTIPASSRIGLGLILVPFRLLTLTVSNLNLPSSPFQWKMRLTPAHRHRQHGGLALPMPNRHSRDIDVCPIDARVPPPCVLHLLSFPYGGADVRLRAGDLRLDPYTCCGCGDSLPGDSPNTLRYFLT